MARTQILGHMLALFLSSSGQFQAAWFCASSLSGADLSSLLGDSVAPYRNVVCFTAYSLAPDAQMSSAIHKRPR